jgi:hypothetical protein
VSEIELRELEKALEWIVKSVFAAHSGAVSKNGEGLEGFTPFKPLQDM